MNPAQAIELTAATRRRLELLLRGTGGLSAPYDAITAEMRLWRSSIQGARADAFAESRLPRDC